MASLLLNTIALDPNRWTAEKQPFYELESLLADVAEAGFRALEVWQYHLSTPDDAGAERLAERLRQRGVAAPIVGVYPALHLEGEAREREWAGLERLVGRAARIGATAVKMFAGQVGSAEADEAATARSVDFTQRLAALAADRGLGLTAETHPDTLCDSVEATRRFLDAVGDDRLTLCYQPFDFTSTRQTVADYRSLQDRIVHVHLQGRRNDEMSLLEEAEVDYRRFISVLAETGFDGALSIEFVKDCVVEDPAQFDLRLVLANASHDRQFVEAACADAGLTLEG